MSVRRRRAASVAGVLVAVLALAACGSTGSPDGTASSAPPTSTSTAVALPVPTEARLVGSWRVVALPLHPDDVDTRMGFAFTTGDAGLTVQTSDGCNRNFGGLTLHTDGRIALGGMSSTLKACAPDSYNGRHIEAMYAASTVGLDDRAGLDQLVLRDETERIVLVLERIPPLSMGALLGTWNVISLGDGGAPRRPLTMDFQLVGTAGSVVTGDGCSTARADVLLSGQYGLRFTAPVVVARPCTTPRDDRLVRSLTQVREAGTDLEGDPQRVTLLTRGGGIVAVLERAG